MLSELKEQNQKQQQAFNDLIKKGRFVWGFPEPLESLYGQHVRTKILQRVSMVGMTSVIFFLLFAFFDHFMLPPEIASVTAAVRIFIVIPIIIVCCVWLYVKPPKYYLLPYGSAFLFSSMAVIWIIWYSHSKSVSLPYEGLMIMMMYGFVVMGLPPRISCGINAITLIVYIAFEPLYQISFSTYLNNVMFLVAMYLAGAVSALIISHTLRSHFLQQNLLNLSEERARLDLESKNRYLAVASHDLRQPLQAINILVDQMSVKSAGHYDEGNLGNLKSATYALTNMFDQLLDASKINLELMELHKEPVDMGNLLSNVVSSFKNQYESQGIALHLEPTSLWVVGDYAAIQRIVNNLLQNALVHSGASKVNIQCVERDGEVKLVIRDNGKGIALEHQQEAFEEFNQLDSPNKDQGLGVGLSIVSKLVKAMAFKLEFYSLEGCEFAIGMPICSAIQYQDEDEKSQILIIEDDEILANQYLSWFKNWDWSTRLAHNLKQAKDYLQNKPQWVITDWNLPDGYGSSIIELINSLKDQDPDYHPYVLVISSNEQLKELDRSSFEYLSKPITPSRLRAALQEFELQ